MSSDRELRATVERIDALVDGFARSSDAAVRRSARELVGLLLTLYGAGLARILQILELEARHGPRVVELLLADDLIASLLVLHDLHPDDAETRIRRGLKRLESAAGASVTLLDVHDGVARVKVQPRREAQSAALLDLQRLIEDVVRAVAPDIGRVDVEGLPPAAAPLLVQLSRGPSPSTPPGLSAQ